MNVHFRTYGDCLLVMLGMIDSSGLRFHYTKQLRKYEAGVLFIGTDVSRSLLIPPGQMDWKTTGFCSADCTKEV